MALVHPIAEYCAVAWDSSRHCSIMDVQLRKTMQTITGTLIPQTSIILEYILYNEVCKPRLKSRKAFSTSGGRKKNRGKKYLTRGNLKINK